MRSLSIRLLLCLACVLLTPALFAHDVTITGTQTFASLDGSSSDHDGSVNGIFTVNDGNLTVSGTVNCIDTGSSSNSACAMAFSVSGNMTISSGAALYGENRTGGGTGGAITLTVGGNLALSGTAIVSSASTSNSGGNGGAITATVGGSATIDSSAIIDSGSKNAGGGAISLTAATVTVNGSVLSGPSRTILSTKLTGQILDGTTNTAGGAITIYSTSYAAPALSISSTANVVSQGQKDGAGTVTIDGCGISISGLVAAISTKDSASVVVVRSGKTLTIDGRVRADALSDGAANDRVDLFARRAVTITGPSSGTNYAVSSSATTNKGGAGTIRVVSLEGTVTATGRAFNASASGNNAPGGAISIGSADNANLDSATLSATGTNAGGDISARSYSGDVFWRTGTGDVRPIGSTSGIPLADQGTIVLNACGTVDTTGSSYPVNGVATSTFPETHTLVCSPAAPSLPSGTSALNICNTTPVANDTSPTTNEDTALTITLSGSDADGDTLTFTVVSGPSHGTLGSVVFVNGTTSTVSYTPALNYNGTDSFVFRANDGNGGTDDATANIVIASVNDAPSFLIGPTVSVLASAGAQTYTNWATSISAGPTDESGQTVTFSTSNDNNLLFSVQPAVASNGTLTFTPAANANGSAILTVTAQDSGGILNGGVDTSASQTSTITVESAPFVVSTSPVNGATNSASNVNIVITYSEAVTASGTAYTIACTPSNTSRPFVLSGNGTATHTLDPTFNLQAGNTCTVTVLASQITDVDANDPPDNMAANYSFSFTVDANPQIISTSPNGSSTNVATNTNITINWTEAVTMTTVGISCASSGSHTSVLTTSDNIAWTVNPDSDFAAGELCTVSILSASVTDNDTNDPPDNPGPDISFDFTTDAAPSVTSTSPTNGSTNNATNSNIVITYSEAVTASGTAYKITCTPSTIARPFVLSGNGTAVHTLDPNINLSAGQTCTVAITASQICDVDSGDPPDTMAADYSFSFTTDANPQIITISPNDGSTNVATNANTTITWTEAVTMTSVDISCAGSGSHTSTLSSSDHIIWTVDPDSDFAEGELCTVTVFSSTVTDDDTNDPPDNPGPDISWQFTTDSAPSVQSTSPASGSTNNASNSNIVITYSEPVTASGTAYTIKCTPSNSSRPFVLSGSGTAVHTLDPNTNLPAGQTCTVTILASQISDVDAGDPPDNLPADYSFSFTTDANPQIIAISPNDGSTNVATNANHSITWTEAVNMTTVNISCAGSGSHTSTLSTSDNITWTVDPDTDYAEGELCTMTVLSSTVTDVDANDPPDNPGPDISWQYTTDSAPSVVSTSPASGSTNNATNTNIVITYSEAVTASGTAYTITCPSNRTFVLSGNGTATHTLDPNSNLPAGQTCTVTINASQISDVDSGDPPDNLAANYSFTFSNDANPQIIATSPIDGSTGIATNTNISITWTEAVTMTSASISCASSGSHTSTLSTSDSVTWTVNPDVDFSGGELCTVTIFSSNVTDNDTNDPPDNPGPDISWQFTTDSAPSVTSTTPSSGSTNNATNTNIVITYSEAVTASGSAYTITCTPSSTSRSFVLSGNGTATHTLDPNSNLSAGQTCTVTINASQISDTDSNDPPDGLAANYSLSFTTDANPQIIAISPNDGSTSVATNSNITITWTETVTMTAVGISCASSGSHTSVLTTSDNITWTVNPDTDFSQGELCTVSVLSANVTDNDTNDPPDNPGPDISWQFTTDSAPTVSSTSPSTGSTNNVQDTNIVITYSEPVTASGTAYTITCPANRTYVLTGNGTATHTLDPNVNLTAGQTCTVTINASQISDTDSGDPPDNMAANYSFQFSIDANPQIASHTPIDGSTNVATNANVTITWTEAVTMTSASISCASSGSHPSALSTSDNITWTVNPDTDFANNELCTVTIFSSTVTDNDTNDPPDNPGPDISWSFTTAP